MADSVQYTLLLDEAAMQNMERLQKAYGLQNKAEVCDLAVRVLTWSTEQQVQGMEVGRFNPATEEFQPVILPQEPDKEAWVRSAQPA